MKTNFKCPKCKTQQRIGKRLRGKWTCPNCHNTIVPRAEYVRLGYVPFKKSAMFSIIYGYNRPYKKYNRPHNNNKKVETN